MLGRYDDIEDYRTALQEHMTLDKQASTKAGCLKIPVRTFSIYHDVLSFNWNGRERGKNP